ncbi:MAG: NAD(P)H-hydrate dehydratase [Angelakisella sp.]
MKFATTAAMRRIEELENQKGTSYFQMMQEAGNRSAELLCQQFDFLEKRVTVLCGNGNNGGDGFVVAARLQEQGARVTVVLCKGSPATEAASMAFDALPAAVAVVTLPFKDIRELILADFIIDAIYGIGFHGQPGDEEQKLFCRCRKSEAIKISLDIPSGVVGDNGRYISCFQADMTIAMGVYKPAHLVSWRQQFAGEVILAETSLTSVALQSGLLLHSLTPQLCSLPHRQPWGHKGNNGRLALVCGSRRFPGAAVLACAGALHSGVGYVHLLATQHVCNIVAGHFPEVIYTPLPENEQGGIDSAATEQVLRVVDSCNAVAVGCGMGSTPHTAALVTSILRESKTPLLLDADGLNCLEGRVELLATAQCPVVITPHPGEFSRLARAHIDMTSEDYTLAAAQLSVEADITLLLKGAVTGIFRGKRQPVFSFQGSDCLARGGSGDLLSGIIASLMAQGLDTDAATLCGAWLHGRSAVLAAEELNHRFVQPSDLIEFLEAAIEEQETVEQCGCPLTGGGLIEDEL